MSFVSIVGTIAALAAVLGLMLLTLAALRRFMPKLARRTPVIPLEVVQRVALGRRQALAIVRLGERLVLVSMGEGGVRFITEVGTGVGDETTDAPERHDITPGAQPFTLSAAASQFTQALRNAVRVAAIVFTCAVAGTAIAPRVHAQAVTQAAAQDTTTRPAKQDSTKQQAKQSAPRAATAAAPSTAARVDTMIARLAPQMQLSVGNDKGGGLKLSGTVGIVVMMGLLTLLPAVVLMMTGFTRILIVLNFLRQAIGAQSAPPAQLVAGLSLLLTLFVMAPTLDEVNTTALGPWMDGKITQTQMLTEAAKPFRKFMLRQTRQSDLETFVRMSRTMPTSPNDVSLIVLTSAFVTSELRVAFQIGFALFLPFIVIDMVVAAVLMSMGMMMVPPAMISLPFKLLLFVLVDGWSLVIQGLVQSFH